MDAPAITDRDPDAPADQHPISTAYRDVHPNGLTHAHTHAAPLSDPTTDGNSAGPANEHTAANGNPITPAHRYAGALPNSIADGNPTTRANESATTDAYRHLHANAHAPQRWLPRAGPQWELRIRHSRLGPGR